ncbi:DUF5683 domain-containing protein [Lacibacter sediminis]|uniref:DUF5683 domain-containing protein n=1 Tax=Lacibacter sediminis TaxID=2760713 RepID=A0A7G5XIZ4_9BACT|nr:DUF5683 domain-containing protein [Lacibacter sediminis]QNA45447.1 hypothetical protein H4075_04390 [Lacibacter sediminis]
MRHLFFLILISFGLLHAVNAQDTAAVKPVVASVQTDTIKNPAVDTIKKKAEHSPRKATIRSAIIPGWGQAYNKKYWKIPIVYGALGTAAGFFIYNRKEYIDARDAYRYKVDTIASNDYLIKPKFQPVDAESVRQYRIGVRQYVDYSVLIFILLWGLNVVDATVDGHLKAFEVSDDLSMRVNPTINPVTKQASVGLVFTFGKNNSAR